MVPRTPGFDSLRPLWRPGDCRRRRRGSGGEERSRRASKLWTAHRPNPPLFHQKGRGLGVPAALNSSGNSVPIK
ncbi:Down Syndrome Cell Adhesion Molecule [Manis pentadactyla]|nr:Down Syndrome Cell Adhesion Molecule [Manis pentadactyla]